MLKEFRMEESVVLGGLERILWRRQDLKWDCGGSGGFGHLVRSSEGKAQREELFEQRLAALNLGMLVEILTAELGGRY